MKHFINFNRLEDIKNLTSVVVQPEVKKYIRKKKKQAEEQQQMSY